MCIISSMMEANPAISITSIAHIRRDHLVHLDQQDQRDLQVIKEQLETEEGKVHQVKMENLVYLESQESVVT